MGGSGISLEVVKLQVLVLFGVPFAVPALIGTMVAWQISKFETIYEGEIPKDERYAQEKKIKRN